MEMLLEISFVIATSCGTLTFLFVISGLLSHRPY